MLSSTVATALLAGAGFLAWETSQDRVQRELDETVTSAGLGGVVQSVMHIDFALGALERDVVAVGQRRAMGGPPLRWLREWPELHDVLEGSATEAWAAPGNRAASADVVNECLRKLMGVIRDWAGLLTSSVRGRHALVTISFLRTELMQLEADLRCDEVDLEETGEKLQRLRARARVLAIGCERASGASVTRTGMILDARNLGDRGAEDFERWLQVLGDGSPDAALSGLESLGKQWRGERHGTGCFLDATRS